MEVETAGAVVRWLCYFLRPIIAFILFWSLDSDLLVDGTDAWRTGRAWIGSFFKKMLCKRKSTTSDSNGHSTSKAGRVIMFNSMPRNPTIEPALVMWQC
jgi:hypothetical protein